jgi:thiol-disulfide isomerase/thioredoxin
VNTHELLSDLRFPIEGPLPGFEGANAWLNSDPLTPARLEGKVVLVDFWTYTCINWLRTLPYLRAWASTYADRGLVVVGVHTPEFEVEHDIDNVRRAARDMGVEYPIAIDNDYAVWNAFRNQFWPALYIADAKGRLRHHHFGEGGYDTSERAIRRLLSDAGASELPDKAEPVVRPFELDANWPDVRSPETYVGLARATGFASPGLATPYEPHDYTAPDHLQLNQWALSGNWTVGDEEAIASEPGNRITFRFHARDLHLILAPPADGAPARFKITLDGESPQDSHGLDVDAGGYGLVQEARLHQLVRQRGPIADREFEIEFLDPGVAALCFTFG